MLALAGTAQDVNGAQYERMNLQRLYDMAYSQCMYSCGAGFPSAAELPLSSATVALMSMVLDRAAHQRECIRTRDQYRLRRRGFNFIKDKPLALQLSS